MQQERFHSNQSLLLHYCVTQLQRTTSQPFGWKHIITLIFSQASSGPFSRHRKLIITRHGERLKPTMSTVTSFLFRQTRTRWWTTFRSPAWRPIMNCGTSVVYIRFTIVFYLLMATVLFLLNYSMVEYRVDYTDCCAGTGGDDNDTKPYRAVASRSTLIWPKWFSPTSTSTIRCETIIKTFWLVNK